jgi:glucose-1-phosphate cytidylyltransferase
VITRVASGDKPIMKAVILAGGLGSRLSEETHTKPKPMVEIGDQPILWHIMKMYTAHGINDFVICLGYKGNVIKSYFSDYHMCTSDMTFDFTNHKRTIHASITEPWRVTLVDTGAETGTGGRLKRVIEHVQGEDAFCFTYGDGVGNIDISRLIGFHRAHGKLATVTVTRPVPRFGLLHVTGDTVTKFQEKPRGEDDWVNGGFFVLSPKVGELIAGDSTYWEQAPMKALVEKGELKAYKHDGFWQPMDTLRDRLTLEEHWKSGRAPWKMW